MLALSFDAALWVVAAVMVAERVTAFALANPAIKVIYTHATPDEKYKVQNFVDTVVFRGGDATSGWLYAYSRRRGGLRCEHHRSGRDADGARYGCGWRSASALVNGSIRKLNFVERPCGASGLSARRDAVGRRSNAPYPRLRRRRCFRDGRLCGES